MAWWAYFLEFCEAKLRKTKTALAPFWSAQGIERKYRNKPRAVCEELKR
jgi:hypothetical protein